ncbi:MAG: GapR family DNA-binding domain-containing protein [Rhodospirillaceae bacterium]
MDTHGQTTDKLKAYVERLERLLDEVDALKDSIKDLRGEIKGDGFNVKAVERIVAFRRSQDAADKEAEFINDVLLYAQVTGTPLGVIAPEPAETAAADTGSAP